MSSNSSGVPDPSQPPGAEGDGLATTLVRARRETRRDPMAESAYLIGVRGPSTGEWHTVRTGKIIVGRGEQTDVRLVDDTISRHHAKFVRSLDGTVHVVDLGSTNGTFVNGNRADVAVLSEGDLVEIGDAVLRFTRREPGADVTESVANAGGASASAANSPVAGETAVNKRPLDDAARADAQAVRELSARQLEVARSVALGLSNADIGKRLNISPRTVSTHLENIYKRLAIRSRAELVHRLTKAGLTDREDAA